MADNDENDFIAGLFESICYFTDLRGLPEPDGHALAAAVTEQIRERYQGERVTIKKADQKKQQREQIRAAVRAEFNGRNVREIMERYGISRRTVYNYIK